MTREEIIKIFNEVLLFGKAQCTQAEFKELAKMSIKALEQEPCEDCISRKAVLDKIKEVCFSREQEWIDFRVSQGSNGQRDLIINFIENLPSVQNLFLYGTTHSGGTSTRQKCKELGLDYSKNIEFGFMEEE